MGELIDLDDYKRRLEEERQKKEEENLRFASDEDLEYLRGVVERIVDILDKEDIEPTFFFVPFPSGSQNEPKE